MSKVLCCENVSVTVGTNMEHCAGLTSEPLSSYVIPDIIVHCHVECSQATAVHYVFTSFIISSQLLTRLDHFLEFVKDETLQGCTSSD